MIRAVFTRGLFARLGSAGSVVAGLFLVIAGSAALSIDVPREAFSPKGDESTYVSMALSLVEDGDFRYEAVDLRRFWSAYGMGPDGIFLKRGAPRHLRVAAAFPFILFPQQAASDGVDLLYYGKAFIYAVAAWPFVRLAGVNGLLLMNVVLLAAVLWASIEHLRVASSPAAAVLFGTAFVGASVVVVYTAWLTPEILNFFLVFFAYWLWFRHGSAAEGRSSTTGTLAADVVVAILLGLVTYSKPTHLSVFAPVVALTVWRRQFARGAGLALVYGIVTMGCFGAHALITGEANYQGGERETFYGTYPFESRDAKFQVRGQSMATNELIEIDQPFDREVFWPRLLANARYFVVGRDFGFLPYFFPGVMAWLAFLVRRRFRDRATLIVAGAFVGTIAAFIIWWPFSWSGGGGPAGNRYFLSTYAVAFFLAGPAVAAWTGLASWVGGALFIGHILVSPLYAAKATWATSQRGLLRALPVELTMVNDLPVQLVMDRTRVPYSFAGRDVLLYLLDENAYRPEGDTFWVRGASRADVIVRSDVEAAALRVTLECPLQNDVTIGAGAGTMTVRLEPGVRREVLVPAAPVVSDGHTFSTLLSVSPRVSFVPRLRMAGATDFRVLGVNIQVAPVPADRPGVP